MNFSTLPATLYKRFGKRQLKREKDKLIGEVNPILARITSQHGLTGMRILTPARPILTCLAGSSAVFENWRQD